MEPAITINNKTYELVKIQRAEISAIYTNGSEYVRIGQKDKILNDLKNHNNMAQTGFPVARVLSEGDINDMHYFIETSLGEQKFGKIFANDIASTGEISAANFDNFVSIASTFARAQINTQSHEKDFTTFAKGIHIDTLCEELPEYKEKIMSVFNDIKVRLANMPFVVTHGDFNPNNSYPAGVIDFEDSFHGPFGYDIISAMVTVDYFPTSTDYEYFAKYKFTNDQKQMYYDAMDSITTQQGLPKLSDFKNDFEFCRASWLLVHMHKAPKLQQYRYDLFINKFLQ